MLLKIRPFSRLDGGMIEPLRNDPLGIRCNTTMRFSCKEMEKPGFVSPTLLVFGDRVQSARGVS